MERLSEGYLRRQHVRQAGGLVRDGIHVEESCPRDSSRLELRNRISICEDHVARALLQPRVVRSRMHGRLSSACGCSRTERTALSSRVASSGMRKLRV